MKVLILRGLPASGKSTYALELVAKDSSYIRINKDSIREMIGQPFSNPIETLVKSFRNVMVNNALDKGYNVIIDDINLSEKHINYFKQLCEKRTIEFEINDDFMNVSLDVLLERNRNRERFVPEDVIKNMYNKFVNNEMKSNEPIKPLFTYNNDLSYCIICDIDGTVALHWDRSPFEFDKVYNDVPNVPVMKFLERFNNKDVDIIFLSGREGTNVCREQTELWLVDYLPENINKFKLYMRNEGDFRKDAIIKEELYNEYIKDKYNVLFVLDDRNQTVMKWRNLGLPCFQVAYGDF